ncbi:MAG: SGNH/GDSL hydrolase family protein [Calditrichaceae bacterium]
MFKAMAESQFPDDTINVKFIGGGGATLKEHWEVGEALREIKSGYWDYVVLQGQSMLGSRDLTNNDSPKQFYDYARKLNAEIINSGAKTVFFMTWSRKRLPEQQKYLTKAYQTIAKELGSLLAPVGLVWGKFHEISTIDLYMPDGSHPSKTGTFLSALTLFGAVFQTIPDDISGTLYGQEILRGGKLSIEKTRSCDLSKEQVKLLRKAVADVMFQKEKK